MSGLISQIETARLLRMPEGETDRLPGAFNLIDHLIWRLSEMAGIERAIIGSALPRNRPLPLSDRRLIGFSQNFITNNWRFIAATISKDDEVREALDGVVASYFGDYLTMRRTILEADEFSDDISVEEWFNVASAGIQSFLRLREAHANFTTRRTLELRDTASRDMYIQFSQAGLLILVLATSYFLTKTVVTGPIGRLTNVIRQYEEGKDLTFPIPPGPVTELTELVGTLNSLGTRLKNVYREQQDKIRSGERAIDIFEHRFSELMEAIPIGVLQLDASQNLVFANSYWCWLTGLGVDELAGDAWRKVFVNNGDDVLQMDRNNEIQVQELKLRSRKGDIWAYCQSRIQISTDGVLLGYIVTLQDITAKKNAQDLLQSAQRELVAGYQASSSGKRARDWSHGLRNFQAVMRAVLDNSPSAIYLKDTDGHYRLTNKAFDKLAGPDTVTLTRSEKLLLDTENPEAISTEHVLETYDHTERVFSTHIFPIFGEHNALLGTGGIMIDVTGQRESQREVAQLQKIQAVGQLTSGVAHDFSNILTSIIGNLEMLQSYLKKVPATAVHAQANLHAQTSLKSARRGELVTQRLLAFSRQQVLKPELVDVNFVIDDMLALFKEACGDSILIRTSLARQLGWTMIDRTQLDSALLNIVLNSRDAMANGGLISVETDECVLVNEEGAKSLPSGRFVRVTISDSGEGIPESVRARVFEPFFSTKKGERGTGLGLSVVYGFVEQSGGFTEIDSRVGSGTRVRLYFPAANVDVSEIESSQYRHKSYNLDLKSLPHGNEIVMIVEDDPDVMMIASSVLDTLGYRVRRAENAADALASIKLDSRIDLLFTDLVMPGELSGLDLSRVMKRKIARLKVLLTTGYSEEIAAIKTEAKNINAFLQKPYDPAQLANKIRDALDTP